MKTLKRWAQNTIAAVVTFIALPFAAFYRREPPKDPGGVTSEGERGMSIPRVSSRRTSPRRVDTLRSPRTDMTHWQPDLERLNVEIVATPAGHPIDEERLAEWRDFLRKHGHLPPVLITADGWMVNGHHRLIVAREHGLTLWGHVVELKMETWIATGNVIRVR